MPSNSRMPDRYVHIVNSDVDEALFEHYGIKKHKNTDKKTPQFCLICKNANPYDSTICSQCGKPLDLAIAIEQEQKEKDEKESLKAELATIREDLEKKIPQLVDEAAERIKQKLLEDGYQQVKNQ